MGYIQRRNSGSKGRGVLTGSTQVGSTLFLSVLLRIPQRREVLSVSTLVEASWKWKVD